MSFCRTPGCARSSTGYSHYCDRHKARDRRHGHPSQRTITKAQLAPYRRIVRDFLDRRPEVDAWHKIEAVWQELIAFAESELEQYRMGRAACHWDIEAYRALVEVDADTDCREIIETVAGMVLMLQDLPNSFPSDRSFRIQLARRFRGLSGTQAGTYWDHVAGRVKRVYRDPSPRTQETLGMLLMEGLGVVGLRIAKARQRATERARMKKQAVYAALEEIENHEQA